MEKKSYLFYVAIDRIINEYLFKGCYLKPDGKEFDLFDKKNNLIFTINKKFFIHLLENNQIKKVGNVYKKN
jgi:hypothetical protein